VEEHGRLTDAVRLRRLRETGLLEDDCYPSLDRLASAAAQQTGAPVALVSMVGADSQVFASQVGLGEPWASRRGTPMSHSICQYVVIDDAPLIVPDTRADPRLRDSPAIDDLQVAAYVGYPLHAPDGAVLGSFCVIDTVPHDWTPQELAVVQALATAAETDHGLEHRGGHALRLSGGRGHRPAGRRADPAGPLPGRARGRAATGTRHRRVAPVRAAPRTGGRGPLRSRVPDRDDAAGRGREQHPGLPRVPARHHRPQGSRAAGRRRPDVPAHAARQPRHRGGRLRCRGAARAAQQRPARAVRAGRGTRGGRLPRRGRPALRPGRPAPAGARRGAAGPGVRR
jgi:hypothetical protein